MRSVLRAFACLVLLGVGVIGVRNGIMEWHDARSLAQQSVVAGVELYGWLGLAAGIGLALRRRWSVPITVAWGVVCTYVAPAAVLSEDGADASVGSALAAGVGAFVTVAIIAIIAHRTTVPRSPSSSGQGSAGGASGHP